MSHFSMIPILLITRSKKYADKYVRDYIKKNSIAPSAVFTYEMDGTVITIDQIREISGLFARHDPTKKLICIFDFDTAKEAAQNALLKTLEDKADLAQFIIVAKNEQAVLSTIASRCTVVKIKSEIKKERTFVFDSSVTDLLAEFSFVEKNSDKAIDICDNLLAFFQKEIQKLPLNSKKITQNYTSIPLIVKEILRVRNLIDRNNLGSQIAIDHLFIFIKKNIQSA